MEQQVIEAALAVIRPTTPTQIRTSASNSLEQWTHSPSSWPHYLNLLSIFFADGGANGNAYMERISSSSSGIGSSIETDVVGVKLLLLTMLRTKCRQYKNQNDPNINGTQDVMNAQVINIKQTLLNVLLTSSPNQNQNQLVHQLVQPICSSIAALSIRTSPPDLKSLIFSCFSSISGNATTIDSTSISSLLPPPFAIQMLSCIPEEVQLWQWTGGERDKIHAEMKLLAASVLNCVMETLTQHIEAAAHESPGGELALSILQMLIKWIEPCQITLVHLQSTLTSSANNNIISPNQENQPTLLSLLVQILCHPNPLVTSTYEQIVQYSSLALTEAFRQPYIASTVTTTVTHAHVITYLLTSIAQLSFLVNPYACLINQNNNNAMDDCIRAIINIASTLAVEEMDTIAKAEIPGSIHLIELLLQAQSHPNSPLPVAINILEVWLALQDVPTSNRNTQMTKPLAQRLLKGILEKIQYPPSFISWEEECGELDNEFLEFRRLVKDVLISCYFLLRVEFIQEMGEWIIASSKASTSQWYKIESALFSICAAGREICARVKARGGSGSNIVSDKDATVQKLLQLAQILCSGGAELAMKTQHPLVLALVAQYLGTFAPVWNVCTDINVNVLLEMLDYLRVFMSVPAACEHSAQSIKRILIACSSKLTPNIRNDGNGEVSDLKKNVVLSILPAIMDGAFSTNDESCLKTVAEGCARFIVQLNINGGAHSNAVNIVQIALEMISEPVLRRTQLALDMITSSSNSNNVSEAQLAQACFAISITLRVMNEIIRFCDDPSLSSASYSSHSLSNVLNVLWPILSAITKSPICRQHEDILTELLSLNGRIFSTIPKIVSPQLPQLITFVVQAYEETHLPCTLDCVAAIVEIFGETDQASFNQLLSHLINCTRIYVTQQKPPNECPQVIRAFFDLAKRYLLFCPSSVYNNSEFGTIFSLAVACLTECRGERDSTRASLNYLTQLIEKTIKLSSSTDPLLGMAENLVNTSLSQHGESITKICINGLAGGSPQMLWPALSECLFSMELYFVHNAKVSNAHLNENSPCHRWLVLALADESVASQKNLDEVTKTSMIQILFRLIGEGVKSKPMVKMLLSDFGSICKGDKTSESLLSYSL